MGKSRCGAISKDKREVDIYWKNISYRRNLAYCRVMDVGSARYDAALKINEIYVSRSK